MYNNSKIAVFDVCGTLYHSNTTFDFLDFYFREDKKYQFFKKIRNTFIFKAINHVGSLLINVDLIRKIAILFLKGCETNEINEKVKEFLKEYLFKKKINQTHELLNLFKNEGYEIVLMSASLDCIIMEICHELGVANYFASQLEELDNAYTGRLLHDTTHIKADILEKEFPKISSLIVVTDNLTDRNLVVKAQSKYIICWKEKHCEKWRKFRIKHLNFIEMY